MALRHALIFVAASLGALGIANEIEWQRVTDRPTFHLAFDSERNVYGIAGRLSSEQHSTVLKVNGQTGADVWSTAIPNCTANGTAANAANGLAVCGSFPATSSDRIGVLSSLRADGSIAWRREFADVRGWSAVMVDSTGTIWVLGPSKSSSSFIIHRYNSAGTLLGSSFVAQTFSNASLGFLRKGPSGSVYAAVSAINPSGKRFAVIAKFDAGGVKQWTQYLGKSLPVGHSTRLSDLKVKADGTALLGYLSFLADGGSGSNYQAQVGVVNSSGAIEAQYELRRDFPSWVGYRLSASSLDCDSTGQITFVYGAENPEGYYPAIARFKNGTWTYEPQPMSAWVLPQGVGGYNRDFYYYRNLEIRFYNFKYSNDALLSGPEWSSHESGLPGSSSSANFSTVAVDPAGDILASVMRNGDNYQVYITYEYSLRKYRTRPLAKPDPIPASAHLYRVPMGGTLNSEVSLFENDFQFKSAEIELASPPSRGTVWINQNGHFLYISTPSNTAGEDTFTYRLMRGQSASQATAKVVVVPDLIGVSAEPTTVKGGNPVKINASIVQTPNMAFYVKLTESSPYIETTNVAIQANKTTGFRQFSTLPVTSTQVVSIKGHLANRESTIALTITP